jgi:hypothetical protein
MSITLIMMEPRLGLACGKVNVICIKNIILVHVIVFLAEVSRSNVYVCLFLFIVTCFSPQAAPNGALTDGCTSCCVCAKNFLFVKLLFALEIDKFTFTYT